MQADWWKFAYDQIDITELTTKEQLYGKVTQLAAEYEVPDAMRKA